jgi:hypothetical protein
MREQGLRSAISDIRRVVTGDNPGRIAQMAWPHVLHRTALPSTCQAPHRSSFTISRKQNDTLSLAISTCSFGKNHFR